MWAGSCRFRPATATYKLYVLLWGNVTKPDIGWVLVNFQARVQVCGHGAPKHNRLGCLRECLCFEDLYSYGPAPAIGESL